MPIVERLHAEIAKIAASDEARNWFASSGSEPGHPCRPISSRDFIRTEHARLGKLIRDAGVRVESEHGDGPLRHRTRRHAQLLDLINASWTTQAIRAACVLRVPELLAAGRSTPRPWQPARGCHAPSLQRLLRALVTLGLCDEPDPGRYTLSALGEPLREDHPQSLRAWALLAGGLIWQRWAELDESVRSGISHRRRHGGGDGFDDLATNPAASAQFYRAMVDITRPIAGAVARAIDPAGVQRVVDVGGGSGELLAQVLAAHPTLRGVLFDLPQGLEGATAVLEQSGVAARCDPRGRQLLRWSARGGDLYLLKSVLHNWDDERCVADPAPLPRRDGAARSRAA